MTGWVRVNHIGNKSFTFDYRLMVGDEEVATGPSVQVAYDYAAQRSIPVPDEWREKFRVFEDGLSVSRRDTDKL